MSRSSAAAPPKRTVPRVRFDRVFRFVPAADRRGCVKYAAGWSGPVTPECAEKAIAEGAAVRLKRGE